MKPAQDAGAQLSVACLPFFGRRIWPRPLLDVAAGYDRLAAPAETHAAPSLPVEAEHKMPLPTDDAERWRQRAERARAIAEQITDPTAREIMRSVADGYEALGSLSQAPRPRAGDAHRSWGRRTQHLATASAAAA